MEMEMAGSLLEQMMEAAMKNGGLKGGATPNQGGLGDILGQVLGGGAQGGSAGGGLGDILGQVLGGQASGAGGRAQPGGGGLGDILGQVLGGTQGGRAGGGLGDILGQVLGGAQAGGGRTGGGTVSGGGGTLGDAFRSRKISVDGGPGRASPDEDIEVRSNKPAPRSTPGQPAPSSPGGIEIPANLKKYGGIAILSILAWKVLQSYQNKTGAAAPKTEGFNPTNAPGGAEGLSDTLVTAMIGAMQADGRVDQTEQQELLGQLDKLGVDSAERQDLAKRLGTPVDVASIVKAATTPEIAVQIYAASAMAISIDSPEERQYLDQLAQQLKIEPGLAAQVEKTIGRG
jgi:uncharacterized membrane protein YebE (DUF533 family)